MTPAPAVSSAAEKLSEEELPVDNLERIEKIVTLALELPTIAPLPENPTKDDLVMGYANLAIAYANSTSLLQQAFPILVEELRALRDEHAVAERKRKRRAR